MTEHKMQQTAILLSTCKKSIHKIQQFVKSYNASSDFVKIDSRIERLGYLFNKYNETSVQAELFTGAESNVNFSKDREDIEELFYHIQDALILRKASPPEEEETVKSPQSSMSMVRLPKLDLPTFDGDMENWIPFRDSYKNLIHDKKNLASVDKFHYLLAALKEPVKKLLDTISVTDKNYDIAWNLLVSRFDNKRLLIKNHIAALFSMESVKRESSSAILSIVDHFERHVKILNTLGENTEEWSSLLVHLVCSRSDSYTLREWECKTAGEVESPSYVDLIEFLQEQARMLLSLKGGSTVINTSKDKPRYSSSHSAVSASYSSKKTCVVCNLQHKIYDCEAFKVMTLEQKHDVVRKNKLCWNCLATSHMSRECQSKNCRKCGDRHHTYLHPSSRADLSTPSQTKTTFFPPKSKNAPSENNSPTNAPEKTRYPITSPNLHLSPTPPDSTPSTSTAMVAAHSTGQRSTVLLSTAVVLVYGPIGPTKVRALLDSGSELNFITERVVQLLKLTKNRAQMHISGMGGASVTSRYSTVATICSSDHSYRCDLSFQILPKITGNLPATVVDTSELQIPPELNLADPSFALPHRIDMVIGAQLFFSLLCDGQRYISNHSEGLRPILQNTVLGWVVSGPVPIASNSSHSASVALTCTTDDLDFQLSRFWEIEHCPEARSFSKEELACEKLFSDTTTRDELGRFVVRLPTKPEMLSQLGDSATTALKRYHWMQRRLLRDPNLQDQYSQIMREYIELNHMSPANTSHPNSVLLPHHAVIKPTSTTTKCRVVFDGSSRTSTGIAINDCLMVGPTIQDTLVTIVIRFRFNEVALVADITKMFRQIWIHQSDRHLQQIYWKDENDINVRPYVLNTVTYGTACAPYLSTRCLKQLAYDHIMINKHVASKISTDFYMDDLISGDQTDDAAINLRSEVQGILGSAGFELRKWASNSPAVLASIPEALRDDRLFLDLDSSPSIKTLGLIWQPKSDSFHFKSPDLIQSQQLTKRIVVSEMAQLFDPLGILGPVVVKAKIFVQQLWRANLSWDDPLSPNLSGAWESYRSELSTVHLFSVPRRAGEIQLHGFCDASQHAYGACIYVRSSTEDGNIITHLLTAKSRVAPIQQSTIPRLELCSAVLLGHLYTNVISSLNQPTKAFFWSDSMITLHWIHQPPSKFNIYVANRVAEVQRLTVGGSWNHIAGFENPADIISRGATPQELSGNTLWWEGPPWLKLESTNWPRRFTVMDSSYVKPEDLEEKVQQKTSLAAVTADTYPELCEYYSSFAKLVRISAICRRFAQRCRKQERDFPPYLLASEYRAALMGLVKSAQQQSFPRELALVEAGKKSDLRSSPLRRLNPIIDQGILRVGGRLNLSNLSHDRKHQIILPSNHKLTILLVESTHQDLLHAGPSLMIANIRERFWPLDLRRLARRTVRNCVTCFRVNPTVEIQLMGQLPRVRITPARAFLNTGVDFCGPVLIKLPVRRGKPFPPLKAYICVFVCMATKAMHLELVGDLSTDGFIAALKRFVGRRGLPISLYCDNATNFTGASRELRSLLSQFMDQQHTRKVASFCAEISIQFHFIPARAPSFGGLWEAAVRAVKHHLRRVVGLDAITAEAMQTVLCQIEGCLNSRPLTACSEDPDDQQILTPGHFLIGDALKAIPEPDLCDVPTNRLSLWQAMQHKVQRFWKLWSTDYLNQLQQRSKNYFQKPNVVVGKLVLLKEDNLPPLKWSVGRVTAVHPGADNLVRVVDVKVPSGAVYDRPISKICLLPINDAEDGPSSNNE